MLYLFFEKLQNAAFTNLVHIFKKVVNTFVKDKLITLKVLFKQRKKTFMLQFQQCSVMHLVAHTTNTCITTYYNYFHALHNSRKLGGKCCHAEESQFYQVLFDIVVTKAPVLCQ